MCPKITFSRFYLVNEGFFVSSSAVAAKRSLIPRCSWICVNTYFYFSVGIDATRAVLCLELHWLRVEYHFPALHHGWGFRGFVLSLTFMKWRLGMTTPTVGLIKRSWLVQGQFCLANPMIFYHSPVIQGQKNIGSSGHTCRSLCPHLHCSEPKPSSDCL